MISSQRLILVCAAISCVSLATLLFEGMAVAQAPPALGGEPKPFSTKSAPPAFGRELNPEPPASGSRSNASSKGVPPEPTPGKGAGKLAPGAAAPEVPRPSDESVQQRSRAVPQWWSTTSAMTMSAAVLVFGLVVIVLATYLIRLGKSSEAVLRIFGTILIIVIAVFLVVAGYSDTQIAPVMGLLGTIAGYLLGKESKEKPSSQSNVDPAQERQTG